MEWPRKGMSPWLVAVIFAASLLYFGLIIWEQHVPGGTVRDAVLSWQQREAGTGPTETEFASSVVLILGLIWLTFISGNELVTKYDKHVVTLMLVGTAIGLEQMIFRHFFRN
jgi:predicted small integral membrane protein